MINFIKDYKLLVLLLLVMLYGGAQSLINSINYDTDLSYSDGNYIFGVPLTEKLVGSIRECKPYRIKHSERLFQQFWTNSWGEQNILLIEPQSDQTCRIIKKQGNLYKPGYEIEFAVEIPLKLAQKSGDMLSIFLHNKREQHDTLKAFDRCLSGCLMLDEEYKQYDVGNLFDAGANFVIEDLVTYWKNWSIDGPKPQIATAQEYRDEEQLCLATRDKLARLIIDPKFQSKDDFYQAKQMGNLVQGDDFYILPGGENGKWNMEFMQPYSACYVAAELNGKAQYIFKPVIKKDPVECLCW